MSFYIIPSSFQANSQPSASFGRCGPSFTSFQDHRDSNAIPDSLFGALLGGATDDDDVVFDEAPSLTPWQYHQYEQLRRRQHLEEVERRRRILAVRQRQAEIERQIELARREKAARLAWHQEQQRKMALALEYRQRVEAAQRKRQQELEYAQQVRLAKQQQARLAQQSQEKEIDWEAVATHSLFGVLDLVQHLFGEEPNRSTSQADGKKQEKTAVEDVVPKQAEEKKDADVMQVDQTTEQGNVDQDLVTKDEEIAPEQTPQASDEDVELPAEQDQALSKEKEEESKEKEEESKTGSHVVFAYPLPLDEAARSTIKAQDIGVSYDEASHTIQLTGLWPSESHNGSDSSITPTGSDDGHQGASTSRGRSRSPKRSRVSDVDEKTGEEIVKADDDNKDGFVQVPATTTTITKSIRLPQDATVANLRAELTDDGFKVYI